LDILVHKSGLFPDPLGSTGSITIEICGLMNVKSQSSAITVQYNDILLLDYRADSDRAFNLFKNVEEGPWPSSLTRILVMTNPDYCNSYDALTISNLADILD
jgi:hypothetical protein